jgi:1-phosphofructokinase family hexose kinase
MKKKILTVTLNPAIDYTIEVPDFTIDAVNRATTGRRDPGGKGINVATALSQHGLETCVTGFLGKTNSHIFVEHFEKNSMKDHFVYVEGPTREGIKVADPKNVITTDINFTGFHLTGEEIESFKKRFHDIVTGFDFVVLSGSLPAGISKDIYGELASVAKNAGAFVAIDTSGEALKYAIESKSVDLIKPNIDELSEIYREIESAADKQAAVDALAEDLLKKVGMIALSMGEEGSRLYTKSAVFQASAPKIDVKSTVGAGDTFLAGFIGGLAADQKPEESLRTAASWAASKLTMFGPGLSNLEPPEKFLMEISVKTL